VVGFWMGDTWVEVSESEKKIVLGTETETEKGALLLYFTLLCNTPLPAPLYCLQYCAIYFPHDPLYCNKILAISCKGHNLYLTILCMLTDGHPKAKGACGMCMHMWSRASAFPTAPNSRHPPQNLDILASLRLFFFLFFLRLFQIFFHSHRESKI